MQLSISVKVFLYTLTFIVLAFCIYPFYPLLSNALTLQVRGMSFTDSLLWTLKSKTTILAVKNTILVSCSTALLGTLVAVPLSWILTRAKIKKQKVWRTIFCLPYAIPPYIGAIAWINLANPTNGLLNVAIPGLDLNIYTVGGLIWVMSSFFYTFILLSLVSAMDQIDPSLEEAARLSGAGPIKVFFDITLPVILPSLLSGVVLVLLAAAASFGVPALIGGPAGIYLLTTKIYTYQKMGSISGINIASILSFILLGLSIFAIWLNKILLRKKTCSVVSGKAPRMALVDLGRYGIFVQLFLFILITLLFMLPLFGIFTSALSKVQGVISLSNFGLQNFYRVIFEVDEFTRALGNSILLATIVASVAVIVGLFLAYTILKTKLKFKNLIDPTISIPYATPGTVLSLAIILAFGTKIFGLFSIYNTLSIIAIAYFVKYLNFSVRTISNGIGQIDHSLAEAAQVSGASWSARMRTIWFPILKSSLVSSWFLVFMPCFSELTMTILLTGPGLETLGTLLFQLQEYGDASGGGASVLALIIVMVIILINLLIKFLSKGKYGL